MKIKSLSAAALLVPLVTPSLLAQEATEPQSSATAPTASSTTAEGQLSSPAASASPLSIKSLRIEPQKPGPDTLCQLFIELDNSGQQVATQLGFSVKLNGEAIDVYEKQLYMLPLLPGETTELRLFNFWTSETYRPAPKNGMLEIEVELKEAQWTKITTEEDVEVWEPLGSIEAMPSPKQLKVQLAP